MKKSVFSQSGENAAAGSGNAFSFIYTMEDSTMIEITDLPVKRGNVPLRVAHGHFATNHSHINYYIDITYPKTRLSEAQ
jgi:hypothetical protein